MTFEKRIVPWLSGDMGPGWADLNAQPGAQAPSRMLVGVA